MSSRPGSSDRDTHVAAQGRKLPPLGVRERRVRVKFAWYDLWVGAYIDRAKSVLYICPFPTLLVEVRYGR